MRKFSIGMKHPGTRLWIWTVLITLQLGGYAQETPHEVARAWNEAVLHAIRNDFARPTVHARNLFHISLAMYDTWALFDDTAETYLIGKSIGDFQSSLDASDILLDDLSENQREVASYAVYRIASFRFTGSPDAQSSLAYFDSLMVYFGYDITKTSIDFTDGSASALGNYIGSEIIRYGLQDGANEQNDYSNQHYFPVNPPLVVSQAGNPTLLEPDRWQPLAFDVFIDQSNNVIQGSIPDFLSPEWGDVRGFSLDPEQAEVYTRSFNDFLVYHDPGPPPFLSGNDSDKAAYQWGFGLVTHWSAHLDPSDGVLWDISPASIGNVTSFPASFEEYQNFYKPEGGDSSEGHSLNPKTNAPYEPQVVPRGDYARVLAEFWADGPDSETPPGHWFTLLNYVMDHPDFEPNYRGQSPIQDPFEYQVKAYFALGAAMHDVAITAWALKGWYDYIRPISALRYIAGLGQSSDPTGTNYHSDGIPLTDGLVELVTEGDPLAGSNGQHINKIKFYTWRGPAFISDEETDVAGVGWILAENWWPYQRPTFVTPPFAGYVSGHSTYSRAAAEILTELTGDPYFPGGMGEFLAKQNEFLVFEDGPSVDVTLQWATYRDASDQCSLSRIWGGIHPPADDIPGRVIGEEIGLEVFALADQYFQGEVVLSAEDQPNKMFQLYPNPVAQGDYLNIYHDDPKDRIEVFDLGGNKRLEQQTRLTDGRLYTRSLESGLYFIRINGASTQRFLVR
ncbi:MAG: T9SS type A sorting domain-containing protein [Cyclobacteriaceae bacterium]